MSRICTKLVVKLLVCLAVGRMPSCRAARSHAYADRHQPARRGITGRLGLLCLDVTPFHHVTLPFGRTGRTCHELKVFNIQLVRVGRNTRNTCNRVLKVRPLAPVATLPPANENAPGVWRHRMPYCGRELWFSYPNILRCNTSRWCNTTFRQRSTDV